MSGQVFVHHAVRKRIIGQAPAEKIVLRIQHGVMGVIGGQDVIWLIHHPGNLIARDNDL